MRVIEEAYAKINLVLDITGKRADGYHNIRTVMQTVDLYDTLEFDISESSEFRISLTCSNADRYPDIPWDETNLMAKAARALCEKYDKHVNIHINIRKNIPSGAGMARGSADAACVLCTLNTCLRLGLGTDELYEIGASLGADVPFCITGGTALCEGIGEIITPLPSLLGLTMICVKPEASISTRYIYEQIDAPSYRAAHPDVDAFVAALQGHKDISPFLGNYLEPAAMSCAPAISEASRALLGAGCSAVLMTGSGSAVFGICKDIDTAKQILDSVPGSFMVTAK